MWGWATSKCTQATRPTCQETGLEGDWDEVLGLEDSVHSM